MHLVKPTGAPEPVNQRLSRNELMPQRSQRLNLLACRRSRDQHRQIEIAARDRAASRTGVHHQDRVDVRMCREELPGQPGHLLVDLRREFER
jgi:hypothetical protein